MDERLRLAAKLLDGEKMAAVCRELGISRKTGLKSSIDIKTLALRGCRIGIAPLTDTPIHCPFRLRKIMDTHFPSRQAGYPVQAKNPRRRKWEKAGVQVSCRVSCVNCLRESSSHLFSIRDAPVRMEPLSAPPAFRWNPSHRRTALSRWFAPPCRPIK
jgi:hypothetical protein